MEKNKQDNKDLTINDIADLIKLTEKNLEAKIVSSGNEITKSLEAKISLSASETTKALEAKIDSSVDMLVRITQNNFLKLEADIRDIKADTENIKADLNKKVNIIDNNTFKFRIEKLEEKLA